MSSSRRVNKAETRCCDPEGATLTLSKSLLRIARELQGRVHLDRRHPPHRDAAFEDEDSGRRRRAADLGLRRVQHQPGRGPRLGPRAQARVHLPRPDPRRRRRAGAVRGREHRLHPARVQHPGRGRRGGRALRRAGVLVRHRAGVHHVRRGAPARVPRGRRLPRPAGPVLLRRRRVQHRRPRDRGEAPRRVPDRGPCHLRHQRRGHARPVGVPGRPGRPGRGRRPPVGGALAAAPRRPRTSA